MLNKNNKYECYDDLDKNVYHVTFKTNLPSIFKNGISKFWFGDNVDDCYNMVMDGNNHPEAMQYDDSEIVVLEFNKKDLDIDKCDFSVDSGDGWSNEWFRTGIYMGKITPDKIKVYEYDTGKDITKNYCSKQEKER